MRAKAKSCLRPLLEARLAASGVRGTWGVKWEKMVVRISSFPKKRSLAETRDALVVEAETSCGAPEGPAVDVVGFSSMDIVLI